jgi:hypothetical protein
MEQEDTVENVWTTLVREKGQILSVNLFVVLKHIP